MLRLLQESDMDCGRSDVPPRKITLINPILTGIEGAQAAIEGCLSLPGFSFEIQRPQRVLVSGQDLNGADIALELYDYEARCVSHEIDHLEGKVLISRVSHLKRDLTERRIQRLIKLRRW
jgi:peptide deformylase